MPEAMQVPLSAPPLLSKDGVLRLNNFDDTELAFKRLSDRDLLRVRWLFRIMNSPILNKFGIAALRTAMKWHLPVEPLIKATLFRQFCGGETADDCATTVAELARANIKTILDYAVEAECSEAGFERVTQMVLQNIALAKVNPAVPFAVFKVTGIARVELLEKVSAKQALSDAEKIEWEKVKERVARITTAAKEANVPVMIDAEESWIQDAIDELAMSAMRQHNRQRAMVFNTIQLYRRDRLEFLKASFAEAEAKGFHLGVKLVRGAYMEKERKRAAELGYPSPIHDTKRDTDRDYDAALDFCLAHLDRIAICAGTHNEVSSLKLANALDHPAHPQVYFSQLYGMGDHISYTLAANGFNVAKYVPFGAVRDVLPYLMRRAEENSALAGYVSRELRLIEAEVARRRKVL
ncbi:MAG: proline dehydrogenase family protein [Candidatus Thermochlorobacter sp.]